MSSESANPPTTSITINNQPTTASTMAAPTYLRKLPSHDSQPLILESIWHPQATSDVAADLTLVNLATQAAHIGSITHAALAASANRLEIPIDDFYADTKHALTGEPPTNVAVTTQERYDAVAGAKQHKSNNDTDGDTFHFELTPSSADNAADGGTTTATTTLTWRKRKTAQLTIIYGSVALRTATQPAGVSFGALLQRAADTLAQRAAEQRSAHHDTVRLRRAHRLLRDDFEECVRRKLELEQDLLHKFLAVLNEKKRHIRQLEADVSGTGAAGAGNAKDDQHDEDDDDDADADDSDDSDESVFASTRRTAVAELAACAAQAPAAGVEPTVGPTATDSSQAASSSQDSMPVLNVVLPRRVKSTPVVQQPQQPLPAAPQRTTVMDTDEMPAAAGEKDGTEDEVYNCDTQAMIGDML